MEPWTATIRLDGRGIDVTVDRDGTVTPVGLDVIAADAIERGQLVDLTPTGPRVPVARGDPASLVAFVVARFDVTDGGELPESWPDDPRTTVPDGADA